RVATATFDVELRALAPLAAARLPENGERLVDLSSGIAETLAAFDRRVALAEPFFAARLAALVPAPLPYVSPAAEPRAAVRTAVAVPPRFRALSERLGVSRRASLAAAFGALLARLGDVETLDL